MMLFRALAVATALALAVAAAGCATVPQDVDDEEPPPGNGEPPPEDGDDEESLTRVGYVVMREETYAAMGSTVVGSGIFLDVDPGLPTSYRDEPYAGVIGSCRVVVLLYVPKRHDPLPPLPEESTIVTLDAGEALTVDATGQNGPYATLVRPDLPLDDATLLIVYETEEAIEGGLPDGIELSVPGAEFPEFVAETFPMVEPFELTAPPGSGNVAVTVDTTFAWEPSGAAKAVVELLVWSFDDTLLTSVSCVASDDEGEFAFPPETASELGAEFEGQLVSAGRSLVRTVIDSDEGAALILATSSEQLFTVAIPVPGPARR
jgi:hypothetical protein